MVLPLPSSSLVADSSRQFLLKADTSSIEMRGVCALLRAFETIEQKLDGLFVLALIVFALQESQTTIS